SYGGSGYPDRSRSLDISASLCLGGSIQPIQRTHAVNRAMTSSATSKLAATVWTSSLSSSASSSFSRDSAASAATATLLRGRQLRRASCGAPNLASSASRTAANCSVAHTTSWTSAS